MAVDWQQLRHAYLLAAMVFLSLVLLTNSTGWNHLVVLLALIGHAYLASKQQTLDYFIRLWRGDGLKVTGDLEFLLPVKKWEMQNEQILGSSALWERSDDAIMDLNRSRQTIDDSFSFEKSRHDRLVNLKQMAESRKVQNTEMDRDSRPARPAWQLKKTDSIRDLFNSEPSRTQKDLHRLKQLHHKTLYNYKIDPSTHLNGIRQIVNYLCALVTETYIRNQANILALNNLISTYFNLRIAGTPASASYGTYELIELDDVLTAAAGVRQMKYLKWKWVVDITPDAKIEVLSQLVRLAVERKNVDRMIICDERFRMHNGFRDKAFLRLKTLADELNPASYNIVNYQRQEPLKEITDEQLIFTFLAASFNRMILGSMYRQIGARKVQMANYNPKQQISYPKKSVNPKYCLVFLVDRMDSGITHLNIAYGDKMYNCEPGQNNIYSAFYFYLYVIKTRFMRELGKWMPHFKNIVNRIIV